MIRSFDGVEPDIHEEAYVDPSAVVIGDVTIGANASVWPNATIRGDRDSIRITEGANVQDNAVLHEGVEIGPFATVGHCAIVHSSTVNARALVGMSATVLDRSVVGERAIVGASSLVTEDTDIPPETLYAGVPAEHIKEIKSTFWSEAGDRYVELSRKHAATSERLD